MKDYRIYVITVVALVILSGNVCWIQGKRKVQIWYLAESSFQRKGNQIKQASHNNVTKAQHGTVYDNTISSSDNTVGNSSAESLKNISHALILRKREDLQDKNDTIIFEKNYGKELAAEDKGRIGIPSQLSMKGDMRGSSQEVNSGDIGHPNNIMKESQGDIKDS